MKDGGKVQMEIPDEFFEEYFDKKHNNKIGMKLPEEPKQQVDHEALRRKLREEWRREALGGNESAPRKISSFERELIELLNKYAKRNESGTPDFILAKYLLNCLHAFDTATKARSEWFEQR
jgi:glycerophosphoryl diester phosphodiesterase